MLKFILSPLLILLTAGLYIQAQSYPDPSPSYRLEKVNIDLKEDFGSFSCAVEDKEGYIWLSSSKGLNVFDGHSMVSYSHADRAHPFKGGSSNENYQFIERDSSGLLYIRRGNAGGYICFDPAKRMFVDTVCSPEGSLEVLERLSISPGNIMLTLSIDRRTGRYSIRHHERKKQDRIVFTGTLITRANVIFTFGANRFWFVNGSQVLSISSEDFRVQEYVLPIPGAKIHQIATDNNQIFFLDIINYRVYTDVAGNNRLKEYISLPRDACDKMMLFTILNRDFILANKTRVFVIDSSGTVIQNLSQELVTLANSDGPDGLSAELVQLLVKQDKKIFQVSQKRLYRLRTREPEINEFRQHLAVDAPMGGRFSFRAITEDEEHTVYASFYSNIVQRKKGETSFTLFPYAKNAGNADNYATYSLNYWKDHLIWNNMIINRSTGQYQVEGLGGYYEGHSTQYLHHDTLWVFPWKSDSLYCYDLLRKKSTAVVLDKRIAADTHAKLIEEMNDLTGDATSRQLWIATKWGGIACITKQGQLLKKYSAVDLKLDNESMPAINALRFTAEGLWYGCNEGLGLLNPTTGEVSIFRNPLIEDGRLTNRTVFSILPDSDSSFLLGTSRGIVFFNRRKREFCNLRNDHPLNNIEFNRASAFRSSDGQFYFGSTDGLYAFNTKQLQFYHINTPTPAIKLYTVSYFDNIGKQYNYFGQGANNGLLIGPGVSDIEFYFSVPEYDQDVYFSYRILGQSDRWTPYNSNNVVSLYYLSPGDYTLEFKASTTLSDENASYFSMPLVIRSEWYKRTWVIVLFVGFLFCLITAIIRYVSNQRLRRQEDLAELRIKISSDLHDDVGSVLSSIAMQSEMLAYTAPEEQQSSLSEISSMSREVMESMRDIVWAMDSRKDKYENLLDRMRTFAERNFSVSHIKYDFITRDIDTSGFVDPERRQMIYLIFKEAVTNIIRHSNCTAVQIKLSKYHDTFSMIIHDNGTSVIIQTDGLGINNMKIRASKIGATFTINIDNGFKILLEVPGS